MFSKRKGTASIAKTFCILYTLKIKKSHAEMSPGGKSHLGGISTKQSSATGAWSTGQTFRVAGRSFQGSSTLKAKTLSANSAN
jgi:hypothetical protein